MVRAGLEPGVSVKLQNTKICLCINQHQKNNGVVLLPRAIEVHRSYSLLFASMDGEGGNVLKLEKTGLFFQVWRLCLWKVAKNEIQIALCAINKIIFPMLSVGCQECCACELKY